MLDVAIRSDASIEVGKGHLVRAIRLNQALKNLGLNTKIVSIDNSISRKMLTGIEEKAFIDIDEIDLMPESKLYIVDTYNFDNEYYKSLKELKTKEIIIWDDETRIIPRAVDGVINPNIYALKSDYSDQLTRFCGLKYFHLRNEIIRQKSIALKPEEDYALVCMGGSDPEKQTLRITQYLRETTDFKIKAILGEKDDQIEKELNKTSNVEVYVSPMNLSSLMQNAKIAITGAGTMAYELSYLGISTALIILASNQTKIAESFSAKEMAINLGDFRNLDYAKFRKGIKELLKLNRELRADIDGKGPERLASEIQSILN